MLKADGDEDHDREPDAEDFAGEVAGTVAEPDTQADEDVAADAGAEGGEEGLGGFGFGEVERGGEEVALHDAGDVAQDIGGEESAEEVAEGDGAPVVAELSERDASAKVGDGDDHHVAGRQVAARQEHGDQSHREYAGTQEGAQTAPGFGHGSVDADARHEAQGYVETSEKCGE